MNTMKKQTATFYKGRAVVVLMEQDGRSTYQHGVVLAPKGLTYPEALALVDATFNQIRVGDQDWNYDEVLDALKQERFEVLQPAEWWENNA